MEQPELGKKIQELRKLKGLTQEELVERCNINVRTIQRIESGEVSPRSFTIKTILEVLGEDSKTFFKNAILKMSNSERTKLQISWMAGILFAVFSTIGIILESFRKKKVIKVMAKKEMKRFPVKAVNVFIQLETAEILIIDDVFSVKYF